MPTQSNYFVAWWSSDNWGEVSYRCCAIEQAENWLKDKAKRNQIKQSAIRDFPTKEEANEYRHYGEYSR